MQIACHVGAHNTDNDRLLKCFLRNRENFAKSGVIVPPPGRYRKLLHQTLVAMHDSPQSPDARDILLENILENVACDRLLLSNDSFFCVPNMALRNGKFYDQAHERVSFMSQIFDQDEIELYLGITNPATFLPAQLERSKFDSVTDLTFGSDPRELRWSELISRLRDACPQVSLTVWCNEDTPLIWSSIVREVAGLNHNTKIKGGFDLLSEIMTKEGMKRFRSYLADHASMSEIQKRRVISAFLDKFAREDMIEEEINIPGWTDALVDELTEIYDEDVYELSRIPGVNMLAP